MAVGLMTSKQFYEMTERYIVVDKVRVSKILKNFAKYETLLWLEYENEDPESIARSRNYLDVVMNKNKKVWILEYDSELGRFVNE